MERKTVAWASGILLVAVALGAFGAHGLRERLSPEALGQWKTGVEYQFYHGLGLLLLAALGQVVPANTVSMVRGLFIGGILCFCGSLYLLSTRGIMGTEGLTTVLGPITPLGGLLFMAGWAVLLLRTFRGSRAR